jgi:hypothetical protein
MTADAELTGNDYVSIPAIGTDGSIPGISILHGRLAGLIEWHGAADDPLLRLRLAVDGRDMDMGTVRWRRVDRWIPVFTVTAPDGMTISGTYCAPVGYPAARGFYIRLDIDNRSGRTCRVEARLDVVFGGARLWVATPRPVTGGDALSVDDDGRALVLECGGGAVAALAIGGGTDAAIEIDSTPAPVAGMIAGKSPPGRAVLSQSAEIRPHTRNGLTFSVGAGRDRDGARAALDGLRRTPGEQWLRQARLELSHTLRSAQDHRWAEPLNRNLLFNRYFSVGRGIDDDRLYVLRSRSTRCPRPALLNEREALFWTLPALILADPGIAREAMFRVFELASERSGEYARYIDGGAFDSGFVLEHMLLHSWAVDRYVRQTGDDVVLDDPLVRHIVHETDTAAFMRLHPEHMLAATELLPSGNVTDYAYATTANALLWCFCDLLGRLPSANGEDLPPRLLGAAPEVAAAVWQHCTTDIGGDAVLVSSTGLDGAAAVYDDPSFSIALLPFLGFCTDTDPVWRATVEFLRSSRYPLWKPGAVPGIADRSDPGRARTSALCADVLANLPGARERLLKLQLPGGVAAGAYDVETGACSDPYDAALAGFLAWSLARAAEPAQTEPVRKVRRA